MTKEYPHSITSLHLIKEPVENTITKPNNEFRPYRIVVLGERGVGKTSFIEALHDITSRKPQRPWRSNSKYSPTTEIATKFIPSINSKYLVKKSIIENIEECAFSRPIANFILKTHYDRAIEFKLLKPHEEMYSNLPDESYYREMLISEFPSDIENLSPQSVADFDKIIIMSDYHDITTIRSMQRWVEIIRAPKRKTIICINKCDAEPLSTMNDFKTRKAKLLKHFSEQCGIEFISVKTQANLTFLYKHIKPDY